MLTLCKQIFRCAQDDNTKQEARTCHSDGFSLKNLYYNLCFTNRYLFEPLAKYEPIRSDLFSSKVKEYSNGYAAFKMTAKRKQPALVILRSIQSLGRRICLNILFIPIKISAGKGFTLAEVLITLAIIGVVAAMTIPGLLYNIEDQKWAGARERAVYNIRNAARTLSVTRGGLNGLTTSSSGFAEIIGPSLGATKICTTVTDCFHTTVKDMVGVDVTVPTQGISAPDVGYDASAYPAAGMVLNNGTIVSVTYNPVCSENTRAYVASDNQGQNHVCANFLFDTNGQAGPNQVGKDIGFASAINPGHTTTVVAGVIPEKQDDTSTNWTAAGQNCIAKGGTWHLPTKDELNNLWYNNGIIGAAELAKLAADLYWSSTEYAPSTSSAWAQTFGSGPQNGTGKGYTSRVRCVRR